MERNANQEKGMKFNWTERFDAKYKSSFTRWVMTWIDMFKIYILYEQCTSVHLDVHACIIINEHTDSRQCVFIYFSLESWKLKLLEGNRQLWWMSWLHFTPCKHALPSCHISNPLAIMWLCVKAVYLFCSPLPHFVPCSPTNLQKSLLFFHFPISAASSGARFDECRSH